MIGMWEADSQKPLRGDSDHDVDGADLRISSTVKHRKGTQVALFCRSLMLGSFF